VVLVGNNGIQTSVNAVTTVRSGARWPLAVAGDEGEHGE
jgi:hypothetical protein